MKHTNSRALVIEDDPSWQQILGEILADSGLVVDIADNLEAAVTSLRTASHRLVVVDLSLDRGQNDPIWFRIPAERTYLFESDSGRRMHQTRTLVS